MNTSKLLASHTVAALIVSSLFLAPFALRAGDSPEPSSAPQPSIEGVGVISDPLGDCRLIGNAERLSISIPAGSHLLDAEDRDMTAPRALQEISGDFTAEVTVSAPPFPATAVTRNQRHGPFQGSGLLLLANPQTYVRLERAQVRAELDGQIQTISYPSWELRLEGKPLRMAMRDDGIFKAANTSLRLSRHGDRVSGAVREEGGDWRELDPMTLKLPEKVWIGIAASQNTTGPVEATFTNFKIRSDAPAKP